MRILPQERFLSADLDARATDRRSRPGNYPLNKRAGGVFSHMFGGLANALKDKAVIAAARPQLQRYLDGFGEITRLELDSKGRTIEAEVMLKGEVSPVTLKIGRYEVRRRGSEAYIVVQEVSASRPWISAAASRHLVGREFPLPSAAATALA